MLLLPCVDDDPGYLERDDSSGGTLLFNQDGTSTAGKTGVGPAAARYRLLTIAENTTLTVDGTLMVNAVTGRPAAGHYDQDVTGGYAEIVLNGAIAVHGTLENFGYGRGSGVITATVAPSSVTPAVVSCADEAPRSSAAVFSAAQISGSSP